jgi:exopolysaccharide production protein ExoQ
MSTHAATAGRRDSTVNAMNAIAIFALAATGFLAATHLHLVAALAGAAVLLAWGGYAFGRPHASIATSFVALLVAGTKFRTRDADESLAGVLDAQIVLELGLYAAVAAGIAAIWLSGKVERRRITLMEGIAAGYVGIALLSSAWSMAPALTLVRSTQLAIVVALAVTATRVLTPSQALQRTFSAIGGFVLICAALAATFPFASGTYVYPEHNMFRFAWFAVHPIEAATLASLGALGVLSALLFKPDAQMPRPLGLPLALVAGALVVVLVVTSSRGPLLAFGAGLTTLLLLRLEARMRAAASLVGLAALLAIVAMGPALADSLSSFADSDTIVGRTLFRGQTADEVMSLNGRLDLWNDLRPAIAERSLFGYGYQASRSVLLDVAEWAAYAHNALLQALLDLGGIGTLALLSLVAMGFYGAVSASTPWMRAAIASVMVFLVLNSISTESFAGAPGVEMLLLTLCGLGAVRHDSNPEVEP